jgi:flagellar hook protein FlgE
MGTAFSNALSGLTANSLAIDIVSGNLANLNTTGYKANAVSFEDLVSASLGGPASSNLVGGSAVAISARSFSNGSTAPTGGSYDAAIQGNGFFVLRTAANQDVYTRAGNFKLDKLGGLLTQAGDHVQGWNANGGVVNTNAAISDVVLPVAGLRPASTTTKFSLNVNLNANASGVDTQFSSPIQVVDSLGHTHVLSVTYTKDPTTANTWSYDVTIPSTDITTPGPGAGTSVLAGGAGTLTFDANGKLTAPADAVTGTIAITVPALTDGATIPSLNWNIYDANGPLITQFDQVSSNLASSQDGTQAGLLTGIAIATDGKLVASYTNGDSVTVAQIALSSFLNPGSMQDLGNNTFAATSASSPPTTGFSGSGNVGTITGGALESSTVDIAKEFTNLLVYERGYQANSKVITTEDQVVQDTLALIR